jgi:hypothetical protein
VTGLARPVPVMYNKTHAWRSTDKRSEGKARGCASGQPPGARTGGAGPARRHRDLGGASKGRGRLGIRAPVPTFAAIRAPGTAAHAGRAQDLRPGLRGHRAHSQAAQGAPAVTSARARDNMLTNDGTT